MLGFMYYNKNKADKTELINPTLTYSVVHWMALCICRECFLPNSALSKLQHFHAHINTVFPGGSLWLNCRDEELKRFFISTHPQQLLWALGSQSASIVVTAPMHISMKQMRADKQTVAVHSWAWILSNKTYQSNTQYVSPHQQFLSSYTVCSCTTFLEQKNLICFNNLSRVKW